MNITNRRWFVWVPLLFGSVVLSVWDPSGLDDGIVQPVARAAGALPTELKSPEPDRGNEQESALLRARTAGADYSGVFDTPRRAPALKVDEPQPIAPALVAATAPVVPPLPLRFMGRMEQKGKPALFLVWGEKNLVMRVGDVVENTYRLDQISESHAEFTYLPEGQKQTLALRGGA